MAGSETVHELVSICKIFQVGHAQTVGPACYTSVHIHTRCDKLSNLSLPSYVAIASHGIGVESDHAAMQHLEVS